MSKPKEIPICGKAYFAWPYEEQTQIKHKVLKEYSRIWIAKLGSHSHTLFFDCHGGCGAYLSDDGRVHFGSSILVKQIGDEINNHRPYKTGVFYCETEKRYFANFEKVVKDAGDIKIKSFNECFEDIIKKPGVSIHYQRYPTLFLVDPFGYNFAVEDLSGLMNSFGNEIIINFMFDFINRFISKPELEGTLNRYFGSEKWKSAVGLTGQQREAFLVDLFKEKIKEITGAKYVFAFRLCYPYKDQTYYYLIHATNHIDGITYMKDAFARINNGRVQYLGKNNDTIFFFELSSYKADDLYNSFILKYKNTPITVSELWCEIVEDTAYTSRDLSEAIKKLESEGKISMTRVSSKRGSYRADDTINVL